MSLRTIASTTLLTLAATLLLSTSAWAQAKLDTAAKLLPPGDYECKMGSYAFRDCTIEKNGAGVALVLPDGLGHFMAFRAELLPSDDKNQMTLLGHLIARSYHCGGTDCNLDDPESEKCEPQAQRKACYEQPLMARLKVSGGGAKGTLLYYIDRPSYENGKLVGYFKLGNTIDLAIRPKKGKK